MHAAILEIAASVRNSTACLLLAQVLEQRTRISAVRHVGEASGGSVSDLPLLNNFHDRNSLMCPRRVIAGLVRKHQGKHAKIVLCPTLCGTQKMMGRPAWGASIRCSPPPLVALPDALLHCVP